MRLRAEAAVAHTSYTVAERLVATLVVNAWSCMIERERFNPTSVRAKAHRPDEPDCLSGYGDGMD